MAKKKKESTFLQARLIELLGLACIAVGLFCAIAFTTYDRFDPSFNHAIDTKVVNAAGTLGAYISAPILEIIGLGCITLVLVPLIWGWRLLRKRGIQHLWIRLTLLCLATPAFAGMMSLINLTAITPENWPYRPSYGGYVGHYLQEHGRTFITLPGFAIAVTVLALGLLAYVCFIRQTHIASFSAVLNSTIRYGWCGLQRTFRFLLYLKDSFTEIVEGSEYEGSIEDMPSPRTAYKAKPTKEKKQRVVRSRKKPAEEEAFSQGSFEMEMRDNYQLPPLSLLQPVKKSKTNLTESALSQNAELLEKVLEDYGIQGKIIEIQPGPVVTLYALEPAAGTKSARVIGLADDIARSMSASSARIAVIPGKNAIGIELPNSTRETVFLKELLQDDVYKKAKHSLPLALGKDIGGEPEVIDLAKTPHALVAGTTGSGKSVAINAMILSLLYKYSPNECKFIMIDPKMLELSIYQDIPHLLTPVVTEPGKAIVALKWTVKEMENRYRLMSNLGVRNISGYNEKIAQAKEDGKELTRSIQTGFDLETGKPVMEDVPLDMNPLPFIVVIVDEMADLMMVGGKEIESSVQRLAQMARAAGIHVILATQRPSVDVITGVIKANFPTRISFQVSSKFDSRTIIGDSGAEQLLGMGDMLYMSGGNKLTRLHGPFVNDDEVERVVSFIKKQGAPSYVDEVTVDDEMSEDGMAEEEKDSLYDEAVAIVLRDGKASTSYVQRQLKIGYNRAANIIEQMEREGVVSPANHAGKREVLAVAG